MNNKEKTCCFFGHREVTHNIKPKLTTIIENLITEDGVTEFYVGNQGFRMNILRKCTVKKLFSLMGWRMFRRNLLLAREIIG